MGTISDCRQLKVNLKEKFIYMLTTTQRCLKETMQTFMIEVFFFNGIIRGLGETDPFRKPEVENLVALSL
jgi:hypothetical protein